MPERIMYVQLKTGGGPGPGPAWIARVYFSRSWRTAFFHRSTLLRFADRTGVNFYDVQTGDEYWVGEPGRDGAGRHDGNTRPEVEDDVRQEYEAFLRGAALPGSESGYNFG